MGGNDHVTRRAFLGGLTATAGAGAMAGCGFGDVRSESGSGSETHSETESRNESTAEEQSTTTFAFEYDPDAETLEITHDGGGPVRQTALLIRGKGFTNAADADQTSQGRWQGTASGTVDGSQVVTEGDSVTVGVRPDYALRVVSQPSRSSQPETLGMDTGPQT